MTMRLHKACAEMKWRDKAVTGHAAARPVMLAFLLLLGCTSSYARNSTGEGFGLAVDRQVWRPGESVSLRVENVNVQSVMVSIRPLNLASLVKDSNQIQSLDTVLAALPASKIPPIRSWAYDMGKIYPDQTARREVSLGALPPGVYWVRVQSKHDQANDWFAVTPYGLEVRQSRQELLLFAVDLASGRPLPGLKLNTVDERGHTSSGVTGADGVLQMPLKNGRPTLWTYGEKDGNPLFALSTPPATPFSSRTFVTTDRPLYRPSQKVLFHGIVRDRIEAAVPGGFIYTPFAGKTVTVQIHDGKNALVYKQARPTNEYGSFDGEFQLAEDPSLGIWSISVLGKEGSVGFDVQAYRKPEMTVSVRMDQANYVGGVIIPVAIDAEYYFGRPVANAGVRYSVSFTPEGGGTAEESYQGQGITDKNGQLKLQVRTRRLPINRTLSVQVAVSDLSRRTETAYGNAHISAGQFQLSVQSDKSVYLPGEPVVVSVEAQNYDDQPVSAPVRLQLVEMMFDRLHRPYRQVTTRKIATNGEGKASATFTPLRHGRLGIEALGFDRDDNKILATGEIWISGGAEGGMESSLAFHLEAGRAHYRPGEKASLLLETGLVRAHRHREIWNLWQPQKHRTRWTVHPDAWALVTLEGERLYNYRVIHLTGRSTVITMPLTALQFPSATLHVAVIQEGDVYSETRELPVQWAPHKLSVAILPDKPQYSPGETAHYTITTLNSQGQPVPAEVAFGVVDRSALLTGESSGADIDRFFYPGQAERVESTFSFTEGFYEGERDSGHQEVAPSTPSGAGRGGSLSDPELAVDPRIRRRFRDTAYWAPFVHTDATGKATVSFPWPDNLTTWRALAQGTTLATAVGQSSRNVISTRPLLVRLELPRFYVQGDEATLSTIVHNYSPVLQTIHATLEATGARLEEDGRRTVQLPPGGIARLDWKAHIDPGVSAQSGAEPQGARFAVRAEGGDGAGDAMELTLPVQVAGLKVVEAQAAGLAEGSEPFHLDLTALHPGSAVTLTLSPSLAASMFGALHELDLYPYNCAEQTMSKLLPNVLAARTFTKMGINRPVREDLSDYVNRGLQIIYHDQHADGGWNWWDFDQTDGDMTAYILMGLAQIRNAGFLVDSQVIDRGAAALEKIENEQDLNRRADWLLALTYINPDSAVEGAVALWNQRALLDTSHGAALALALWSLTDGIQLNRVDARPADLRRMAAALAADADAHAIIEGTTAHWINTNGDRIWQNDDRIVTARVLQALIVTGSHSPHIAAAVRWLMGNREGAGWGSTITTSHVFMALTDYLISAGELKPNFHTVVALDGQPLQDLTVTPANVFDPATVFTLKPDQLKGHTALTINRQGQGILYVNAAIRYTLPPEEAKPMSRGITVKRTFTVTTEDPLTASAIPSGQDIDVQVDLNADTDYRYVILEDPIPAGCQLEPNQEADNLFHVMLPEGRYGVGRVEMRDDRVVFFLDSLPKGHVSFAYRMHAESPGVYRVQPGIASLVYFPEVRGNSGLVTARITEGP